MSLALGSLASRTLLGARALPVAASLNEYQACRWATKKSGGSTKNGRDSRGKSLGIKKNHGHLVKPGMILCRQRGTNFHAGENVYRGKDFTLHSRVYGQVFITRIEERNKKIMNVREIPLEMPERGFKVAPPPSIPAV